MGPTNSGKTHAALQALKAAETGVYCGPLRLLAWEVGLCQYFRLSCIIKEINLLGSFISLDTINLVETAKGLAGFGRNALLSQG